jgi:hypothetical protein
MLDNDNEGYEEAHCDGECSDDESARKCTVTNNAAIRNLAWVRVTLKDNDDDKGCEEVHGDKECSDNESDRVTVTL